MSQSAIKWHKIHCELIMSIFSQMRVVLKASDGKAFYATGDQTEDPDKVQQVVKTVKVLSCSDNYIL